MSAPLLRIFSDLHYGDRASSLHSLAALTPLCEGATQIVLNGDTLDTRPSLDPGLNAALREDVRQYFGRHSASAIFLTGNHDPDISEQHHLDPGPSVLVTHGDVLFNDLVPWSQDAALAGRLVAAELAALPPTSHGRLDARLGAYRRAAALIPQRHQSERHGLKYLVSFARDTIWPPTRILRVIRAWRETPARADAFVAEHRPAARFLAMGHTHRLGAHRTAQGRVILNTGSFCPPGGAGVIDLTEDRIALRKVERKGRDYRLGVILAEFSLAER